MIQPWGLELLACTHCSGSFHELGSALIYKSFQKEVPVKNGIPHDNPIRESELQAWLRGNGCSQIIRKKERGLALVAIKDEV